MSVVDHANGYIKLLEIVLAKPGLFTDGFSVEWYGVSIIIYDDYDPDTNERITGTAKIKMAAMVRELRRITRGESKKGSNDYYFWFDVTMPGTDRYFRVQSSRENVCTKVVIGKEEKEIIDYGLAPKTKVMVDIVEWQCDSVLALEALQ